MSLFAYFERNVPELRMPAGKDRLGIRFHGAVVSGRRSLQMRMREDWAAAGSAGNARMDKEYARRDRYDAVLRAHLGIDGK